MLFDTHVNLHGEVYDEARAPPPLQPCVKCYSQDTGAQAAGLCAYHVNLTVFKDYMTNCR